MGMFLIRKQIPKILKLIKKLLRIVIIKTP